MTHAMPDGDPGPGWAAEARQRIKDAADRTEAALIAFCDPNGDLGAAVEAAAWALLRLQQASDWVTPAAFEAETTAQLHARRRYPVPPSRGRLHIVPGPH